MALPQGLKNITLGLVIRDTCEKCDLLKLAGDNAKLKKNEVKYKQSWLVTTRKLLRAMAHCALIPTGVKLTLVQQ